MVACFIGHRIIESNENLIFLLKREISALLQKGVSKFLFGSKSEFDNLCLKILLEFKKDYPNIKFCYVRSSYQFISEEYKQYLCRIYDETVFPPELINSGRSCYVKRNYYMIDNSTYCVFYYNANYIPQVKETKSIISTKKNSGTKRAYQYANKKKKQIINVYQKL